MKGITERTPTFTGVEVTKSFHDALDIKITKS